MKKHTNNFIENSKKFIIEGNKTNVEMLLDFFEEKKNDTAFQMKILKDSGIYDKKMKLTKYYKIPSQENDI